MRGMQTASPAQIPKQGSSLGLPLGTRVEAIRRFNRFYTQRIGVLREGLYDSDFSLAEVRVLYELAHASATMTATDLIRTLSLDAGYLSRTLRSFETRGLIRKARSRSDGRQLHLALTTAGREAFAPLERASRDEIAAMIAPLSTKAQHDLVNAMTTIQKALNDATAVPEASSFVLREHRPGDIGWVVARHGALYAREYGWDDTFEALVAEIAAKFLKRFDPKRERCWIAERDGENV
jgi:DNA-binding MarR family transcriptional regulator